MQYILLYFTLFLVILGYSVKNKSLLFGTYFRGLKSLKSKVIP